MTEESTTPDLVGITRRTFEAASRRDADALLSFFAPDAVWDLSSAGIGRFEGAAAIRGFLDDWFAAYEDYTTEPDEVLDLGNGVVSAVTRQYARLSGSADGAQVREVWAYVYVWVDGLITQLASYQDADEARAAAERLAEERG
jgi:ketosteroid isomerase-like protein